MINLILYKKQSEFFEYFKDIKTVNGLVIITPSPVYADLARRISPNAETFTIQSFLQNEFNKLLSSDELEDLKNLKLKKSKLLLFLGFLWKNVFPQKDIVSFRKAYRFLTDLRSFTLSLDVFENALENEEESLKEAVLVFQNFMQDRNIFDEHKGYYELSERLRSGKLAKEYQTERKLIFWGFDFFSPLQMDMLKSLSIRDEVYLGLYESVYESSYSVDWTGWLDENKTNIIKTSKEELKLTEVNVLSFPKNGLGLSIKEIIKNKTDKKRNYFLATKDFDFQKIQEIPENKLLFRAQTNILETSLKRLKEDALLFVDEKVSSDFNEFITLKYSEAVSRQDFIEVKTIALIKETFGNWSELSNSSEVSRFEVELLFDIIELDSPRNNLSPQVKESLVGEILPIKMLSKLDSNELNFICATSGYGSLLGKESFSDSLEKKLTAIGPIRRPGFIFNTLKAQVLEALSFKDSYLVIENGLEKEDLAWADIFSNIKINQINLEGGQEKRQNKIIFPVLEKAQSLSRISATKIQTFLDCPRKYYLQYISKDRPLYQLDDEIGFNVLGTIEHAVIQKYLETFKEYIYESHLGVIQKIIKEELAKNKIELEPREYNSTVIEVRDYTKDAISLLLDIKKRFSISLEVEKDISSQEDGILRGGSIDLFGKNSGTILLFDFKRSATSIPNLSEIKRLEKIQILFYRRALINLGILDDSQKVAWGYINLSEIGESLILTNDEELMTDLSSLNIFKRIYLEKKVLEDIDLQYQELESNTLRLIENETNFFPNPTQASVCSYCEISAVCPKKGAK